MPRISPASHGESSAATLSSAAPASVQLPACGPASLRTYRYVDRGGERTASFPSDSSFDVSGSVKSASSGPLADYQDKLKAIALRDKGFQKADVAQKLGRPEKWVQKWWREHPKLLQRPAGANDIVMQRASLESFRDLEVHRGFACESEVAPGELLREAIAESPWKQAKVLKRNSDTGELDLAYDSKGSTINAGREVSDYAGGIPCIDRLLQRAFSKMDIRDASARIFMNYYADGQCRTGVHRHDFWTCLVSFGADRILTVDNRPLLLRDGDLIVFGTQNHGVPVMPDVKGGRISLVIFYYPDHDNLDRRQWQTITDEDDKEDAVEGVPAEPNKVCDEALRSGCDTHLNLPLLWGEGAAAQTATNLEAISEQPDAAVEALASSLEPATKQRLAFQSPNSSQGYPGGSPVGTTIFTAGIGNLSEKDFFAQLACVGVAQLWDLRALESFRGCPRHAESLALKQCCASRNVVLRTVPLGGRQAGGIQQHLASQEGSNTLAKIIAAAQAGKPLAILGASAQWRDDARQFIADVLTGGGFGPVVVQHLVSNAGSELHVPPERATEAVLSQVSEDNSERPTAEASERPEAASEERERGFAIPSGSREALQKMDAAPSYLQTEVLEASGQVASQPARRTNRWNRTSTAA